VQQGVQAGRPQRPRAQQQVLRDLVERGDTAGSTIRLARSPAAPNRTKTAGRAAGSGCCVTVTTPPSYEPALTHPGSASILAEPDLPVQDQHLIPGSTGHHGDLAGQRLGQGRLIPIVIVPPDLL